jgi:hypothetical protein
MHIEEQRWAPMPKSCIDPQLPGWWLPKGSRYTEAQSGAFIVDEAMVKPGPQLDDGITPESDFVLTSLSGATKPGPWENTGPWGGCYVAKSCTEYASYEKGSHVVWGTQDDILSALKTAFGGKGARILKLELVFGGPPLAAILVPNYGPAARAWWWSGEAGATAAQVNDVINGRAWGSFPHDNIKKKLVSISRGQDGRFRFVMNEWKPGEAWWWGYGASIANITSVINGQAWASFPADNIQKRLVYLRYHTPENWTFLMVPRDGLGWWWKPDTSLETYSGNLFSTASDHHARIFDLQLAPSLYTGLLVQNA